MYKNVKKVKRTEFIVSLKNNVDVIISLKTIQIQLRTDGFLTWIYRNWVFLLRFLEDQMTREVCLMQTGSRGQVFMYKTSLIQLYKLVMVHKWYVQPSVLVLYSFISQLIFKSCFLMSCFVAESDSFANILLH